MINVINTCKKLFCCLLGLTMLLFLTACGGSGSKHSIKEISGLIEKNANFSNMSTLNENQLSNYFDFSKGSVSEAKMVISNSESVADEYAVFKLSDKNNAAEITTAISQHIVNRQNAFRQTSEVEYEKLQNSVIRRIDDYIILVVSENYAQISEVLTKNGAKTIK